MVDHVYGLRQLAAFHCIEFRPLLHGQRTYAKVAGVRISTNDAPPPVYTAAPPGCSLMEFQRLSVNDVVAAVRQLPDKQCASCLPRCRCKSLEHAAAGDHVTVVTGGIQACTEDGTVP